VNQFYHDGNEEWKNRARVKVMKKARKKAGKRKTRKKSSPQKARKKFPKKAKAAVRKKTRKKATRVPKKRYREAGYVVEALVGLEKERKAPAGLQSGDLQGLSSSELVDSQSVDELLEEGNAFEAGVVAAVEDSEDTGPREVRTKEVPVDDVPGEYLDED
jgi:hypothetical protein